MFHATLKRLLSASLAVAVLVTAGTVLGSSVTAQRAVAAIPGTSNAGVRIMPLGDSITDGYLYYPGGYRIRLAQTLQAQGNPVDFVGTQTNGPLMDKDHQGHSGWTVNQIKDKIEPWLEVTDPQVVLLHIGTNDIRLNEDLPNLPSRVSSLIDLITATKPQVQLFVAQIVPQRDAVYEDRVLAYNAALPQVVASKGFNVHLVDMHGALTTADLYDYAHPTQAGYEKMADVWRQALNANPTSLQTSPTTTAAPIGSTITLRSDNGLHVSAWLNAGASGPLMAMSPNTAAWERFTVVDAGAGLIGLIAQANGKYVTVASPSSSKQLSASAGHLQGWEKFRWVPAGTGKVALVSVATGAFVTAWHETTNSPLIAGAYHRQQWETFDWVVQ